MRRVPRLGRAVLLSGSLSESSELELSEDSSLDSPASRGAWYIQQTGVVLAVLLLRKHAIAFLGAELECAGQERVRAFAALLAHAFVVYHILRPLDVPSLLWLGAQAQNSRWRREAQDWVWLCLLDGVAARVAGGRRGARGYA